MTSASVGAPVTPEKAVAGVVDAISMPGSSAAVLTPISTPEEPESCVSDKSAMSPEEVSNEEDSGLRGGLGSGLMPGYLDRRASRGPFRPNRAPVRHRLPRAIGRVKLTKCFSRIAREVRNRSKGSASLETVSESNVAIREAGFRSARRHIHRRHPWQPRESRQSQTG